MKIVYEGMLIMEVKSFTCMIDWGDGSFVVRYFGNLADAERCAEIEEEEGQPCCDAVEENTFTIVDGVLMPALGFDVNDED